VPQKETFPSKGRIRKGVEVVSGGGGWFSHRKSEALATLGGHTGAVNALAWGEGRLASGGSDQMVRLWDVGGAGGWQQTGELISHTGAIMALCGVTGRALASASFDTTVKVRGGGLK
jgi:WD40 repeat protein